MLDGAASIAAGPLQCLLDAAHCASNRALPILQARLELHASPVKLAAAQQPAAGTAASEAGSDRPAKQQSRSASAPDLTANGWHGADTNGHASSAGDQEDDQHARPHASHQTEERRVTVELTAVPGEEGDQQVAVLLSLHLGDALPSADQCSSVADAPKASRSASTLQRDTEDGPPSNGFAQLANGAATSRSASPFQRLPAPPPGADRHSDATLLHEKVRL